jgi:small subunit ribosomal protein S5
MKTDKMFGGKGDGCQEKLISVSRNVKVVKGGRIFSFSALVVVGDNKGKVGMGRGKGKEVPVAIQKAMENARRNFVFVDLNKNTLYHDVVYKHGASKVIIKPAIKGTGIIAGNSIRAVLEVVGVKDVLSKCIGSTNPNNVVIATINGLLKMSSKEYIFLKRGIKG